MSFHIVCDSCTDLTEEDLKKGCYTLVPLTLLVDGEEIIDDETFDQADFLAKVAASKESVKSACPAPESYMEAYSKADDIYVVTLSAELSGSYNSAVLGKNLYEEENGTKNIHVVNSRGAATTQVLIARKLNEYASQGMPFEEVVDKIEEYTTSLRTYFVLETLEVLRKNGRLSRLSATIAGALNIKPVMIGTRDGVIQKAARQEDEESTREDGRTHGKRRKRSHKKTIRHFTLQLLRESCLRERIDQEALTRRRR